MTSKVQPVENCWNDDVRMTSKVQPATDYWTVDRESLATRIEFGFRRIWRILHWSAELFLSYESRIQWLLNVIYIQDAQWNIRRKQKIHWICQNRITLPTSSTFPSASHHSQRAIFSKVLPFVNRPNIAAIFIRIRQWESVLRVNLSISTEATLLRFRDQSTDYDNGSFSAVNRVKYLCSCHGNSIEQVWFKLYKCPLVALILTGTRFSLVLAWCAVAVFLAWFSLEYHH